jgi:hypothetical protein
MHYLSKLYWVTLLLHVSGPLVAHHQGEEYINLANGTSFTSKMSVSWLTDRRFRSKTSTIYYIYTLYLPMMVFFFIKIYLLYGDTHTSVPYSIQLFLVNQFSYITLAVRGVTVPPRRVMAGTAVKTWAQRKKHCRRRVRDRRRMWLGRLWIYFLYWWSKSDDGQQMGPKHVEVW